MLYICYITIEGLEAMYTAKISLKNCCKKNGTFIEMSVFKRNFLKVIVPSYIVNATLNKGEMV